MRYLFLILFFMPFTMHGQSLSSLRNKTISLRNDTVTLDTFSIAPGTLYIKANEIYIDTSAYYLDFINAKIIWKKESIAYNLIHSDSVNVNYRVFSFLLGKEFKNKSFDLISHGGSSIPLYYNPGNDQPEIFRVQGLSRNGSISRGITFGNNQDVFVNSSLNLQLAGKLSDNVEILAAITDENIPVQPEGNTQQIQDFDKVFIQLSNNKNKLIAGDFELRRPDSYFMNFYKKGQGGYFTTEIPLNNINHPEKKRILKSGISLAVSKGKFTRNTISVKEGNQGPYRLTGNNGETFIIVLSGTEKIYFDGILLIRGSQNDYVIDYNTSELSFTARRLITKDSRIVAEFEYSDKNYSRSLIYLNNEFESNNLKIKFNLYSEQDSKNQPLSIDLDSAKKAVMANAGDSIQNAVFPTADSVQISPNTVLYQRKDSTAVSGVYSIYIYSGNTDSSYWQVRFSDVGLHNGNYIQDITSVNGRIFKWIEPLNGIRQGNFEPVALLITPKKQQLVTTGIEYSFNRKNTLAVEGAFSNYDVNLFSKKDKRNDAGYAARIIYKNEIPISSDSINGWKLSNVVNYEYTGKYFKPIERYRNVEFERDWNLGTNSIINDEHISSIQTTLLKPSLLSLTYQLRSFMKGSEYRGLMNSSNGNLRWKKFTVLAGGSYLNTNGFNSRTKYLRHNADVSRPVWKLVLGIKENTERNKFTNRQNDSLLANSISFREFQGYINTLDTGKSKANLSYKQRIDQIPVQNNFTTSAKAEEMNLITEFSRNPDNTFRTITTYRTLTIKDTLLTSQEAAKTIVNRIDHTLNLWNGILSFNTYYEVGNGQERKQEYYYLKVNDGQGVYAFFDYNNNGVEDLNEFVVAAFQNQANFIRVYIPTNVFINTRSNQFSEVLVISPAGNKSSIQGKELFIHRFSDQLSVRLDRKTKDESLLSSLNSFHQELNDTTLISANSSIRNTFYYNRRSPVYGFDFTWQENKNKAFLTNGFETRIQRSRVINMRWNINRAVLVSMNFENGDRINQSDFFSTRDYSIYSNSFEPKLSFQPGNSYRLIASYKYGDKKNTKGELRERAISNKFQMEMKYTAVNSGNITAKASLININYNAADNSFLAYEMLEGFKNGKNITWGLSLERNLNNSVQMSLTYDGRKLQDSQIVHTGGVQFRAFF